MKKTCLVIALIGVMVFSFAATAMADHSPLFYFDFEQGAEVTHAGVHASSGRVPGQRVQRYLRHQQR